MVHCCKHGLVLVLASVSTRRLVPLCVHHSLVWKGWQAALRQLLYDWNFRTPAECDKTSADTWLPNVSGLLPPPKYYYFNYDSSNSFYPHNLLKTDGQSRLQVSRNHSPFLCLSENPSSSWDYSSSLKCPNGTTLSTSNILCSAV